MCTVQFKRHVAADLQNEINEFVTALKDANLGEEREKKIGMELKSLMDKAAAARSKVTPNKVKVICTKKCQKLRINRISSLQGSNPDDAQKAHRILYIP